MSELILPIAPYETRERFVRGGKASIAVTGINTQGYAYMYIEDEELDEEYHLTVRWIPITMITDFDDYGQCLPIGTYWKKVYLSNNKVVKVDEGSRVFMKTNHPDMIQFTAALGIKMIPSIINGKIRAIDGFDSQPLFAPTGARIADETYDVSEGPSFTYDSRQPAYAVVEEEPIADPITEETPEQIP